MLLSIIIVSYNVRHYLRQCLDSVWRSAKEGQIDVEVFVVDNHSNDGTVHYLRRVFRDYVRGQHPHARLTLIDNHCNVGFGRANNQALRKCKGDYVLFLNPDTLLGENTLADCLHEAKRCNRLGAMGVEMLRTNGRFAFESRRGLPTPWTAFCKMSGLAGLFPKNRCVGRYYMRYLDPEEAADIEIVSGAFMFCSHEALRQCGGFDETFFMYGEDIDLSYRFLKAGFRNRYVPTSILHYKGESTHKNSYRYVHVFYQAMLIFFRKHFPASSMALTLPVHAAIYGQAIFTLIKQNLMAFAHYLSPNRYKQPFSMHYVGAEHTFAKITEKAETWGIRVTCSTTVPTECSAKILAFSTEDFRYSDILRHFKLSDHRAHIGTYFPTTGTLILGNGIYH